MFSPLIRAATPAAATVVARWLTSAPMIRRLLVNRKATIVAAAIVAALISGLNLFLLAQTFGVG